MAALLAGAGLACLATLALVVRPGAGRAGPLASDPFTQQGERLTGGGEVGRGAFGSAVALSADGDTALVGAQSDNGVGAAWVFTRSGSSWTQQGGKLTGSGETATGGAFGASVALSADGNTALVGGYARTGVAAAWVFTRSGSTWTQQGSFLAGSEEAGADSRGVSVALSGDGSTAMIGGHFNNSDEGAAWVFTRSGSTWTQQGRRLNGSGEGMQDYFASSMALSNDGNTAVIGGLGNNSGVGAAWVFTRSGSTWTQQGVKLTGGGEAGNGEFGMSVALAGSGSTALVGGPADGAGGGAAWVFTRSGSTWTQQGEKLTGVGEGGRGEFGWSVALTGSGNTALIGGPADGASTGAAWAFARSGSTWSPQGAKLSSGEGGLAGEFGYSVALSGEGGTALIGSIAANHSGAASVFVQAHVPEDETSSSPPAAPVVTNLRQTARTWHEGNALAHISAAKQHSTSRTPLGTIFSFSLNVPASVTFSFTAPTSGRRVGKMCVAQTPKNKGRRRCTRSAVLGALKFSARAGESKVRFDGRLPKRPKLRPGNYTLLVSASASGARSAPKALRFTIVHG